MENGLILTRTAKVWLGEDGIIQHLILPNAELKLEDLKENIEAAMKVNNGEGFRVLADIRKIKFVNRDVQTYSAENGVDVVVAFLIGSSVSKVITNFFMELNKPSFPTKVFTSESKAVEWLKGFIE